MINKPIIDAFFKKNINDSAWTQHNTDSFNYFVDNDIQKIIDQFNPITYTAKQNNRLIRGEIRFNTMYIERPSHITINNEKKLIYPNYCRIMDGTYTLTITGMYNFKIYLTECNNEEKLVFNYDSLEPIPIGKIPCMVGSKYCNLYGLSKEDLRDLGEDEYEVGSYFVVKGTEFIIVPQEIKIPNKLYKNIISKNNNKIYEVWGSFKKVDTYNYPYYTHVEIDNNNIINVYVSIKKKYGPKIPLDIFYKALGILTDKEIYDLIVSDDVNKEEISNILENTLLNKNTDIITQKDALLYIGKKNTETNYFKTSNEKSIIERITYKLLEEELFPHIGGILELKEKILFFNHMVRKCILLRLDIEYPIDPYDYGNKRILTSGVLYGQLFRHIYSTNVNKDLKTSLKKEMEQYSSSKKYDDFVSRFYNYKKMENMERHISTGDWHAGSSKGYNTRVGVSIRLERKNRMKTLSAMNKIVMTSKKRGRKEPTLLDVRKLHSTQLRVLCPHDTPDTENIGKQKTKTILSIITTHSNPDIIISYININLPQFIYITTISDNINKLGKIFINGRMMYCCNLIDMRASHIKLIEARRNGIICPMTTVIYNTLLRHIYVYTDSGRFLAPAIIVDQIIRKRTDKEYNILIKEYNRIGKIQTIDRNEDVQLNVSRITKNILDKLEDGKIDWNFLINNNYIEYLHSHEIKNSYRIALEYEDLYKDESVYTHMEISPATLLGLNVLSNPLCNYNPGTRTVFACQQYKQAISESYVSNYMYRMDTDGKNFPGVQIPLLSTIADEYTGIIDNPSGVNKITAIMTYAGYNLEDSIVCNKDSIDNGMFKIYSNKVKKDMINTNNEYYLKPDKNNTDNYKYYSSYNALNQDGSPKIGYIVKNGDVIIGKVKKIPKTIKEKSFHKYEYQDRSKLYEELTPGRIEKVSCIHNASGTKVMKVSIKIVKEFQVGDKISSRSGQKGTESMDIDGIDLPFTGTGLIPDIIFNTHGIITRGTISKLMEMGLNIISLEEGKRIDGTPFTNIDIQKDIIDKLKKLGYKDSGKQVMYNGITGRKIDTKIFIAPVYYHRLKNMVSGKVRARETGYYNAKTRQPIKGRKRGGGLKIGTMETDALISHGVTSVIREKFFDHSDGFECYISEETGHLCIGNSKDHIYKDKKSNIKISKVQLPWVFIMLYYLVSTTGIDMRFILE